MNPPLRHRLPGRRRSDHLRIPRRLTRDPRRGCRSTLLKIDPLGSRESRLLVLLPVPDGAQELLHIDAFGLHVEHPGVFEHAPGGGAFVAFFFETRF